MNPESFTFMSNEVPGPRLVGEEPKEMTLTKIFRTKLRDLNINEAKLDELITVWAKNHPTIKLVDVTEEQRQLAIEGWVANKRKELAHDNMNWRTFCRGMDILGIREIVVTV